MIEFHPSKEEAERLLEKYNIVPMWTEVVADLETPVSTYMKLAQVDGSSSPSFLLESVEHGERWGRYSFVGVDPFLVFMSHNGRIEVAGEPFGQLEGNPLEAIAGLLKGFTTPDVPELPPLIAGGVGYLGYDVVRYLESLPQTTVEDVEVPEIILIFARSLLVFDHLRQRITVVSNLVGGEDYDEAAARTERLIHRLGEPLTYQPRAPSSVEVGEVPSTMTQESHSRAVERAKDHILAGDIFQVVISHRMSAELDADPFDVYRMLRLINPSPYMFFLSHPAVTVLGSSPEPLIKVQGRRVVQRPIA
ncbi:MAG TPA: chorismate-binding protein, partial [Actinomycetota bacterium]|nr:chorismate-binding protein [Actinomycetota bacterium]